MGGYVAFEFWKLHTSMLSALVLSNTKAAADTSSAKEDRLKFALDAEERGTIAAQERMMPKFVVPSIAESHPEIPQKFSKWIEEANPLAVAAAQRAMAERSDFTDKLAEIKVPTLIIASDHDAFGTIAEADKIAKAIPESSFTTIQGAGHISPVDKPEEWANAVGEFIRSIEA